MHVQIYMYTYIYTHMRAYVCMCCMCTLVCTRVYKCLIVHVCVCVKSRASRLILRLTELVLKEVCVNNTVTSAGKAYNIFQVLQGRD